MNILFVSSEFPLDKNQATGGIGTYLLNITSGLVKQRHKVTIITRGNPRYQSQHKGITIVLCNYGEEICAKLRKILPFFLVKRLLDFIEYPLLFSLGVYFKLKKIGKRQKINIIEGNDFGGELFFYLLFVRKRPPVVLRLHTPGFIIQRFNDEPLTLFYRIIKFLEVYCLKKADSLYSPTKNLAKVITKETECQVKMIIPYPYISQFKLKNSRRQKNLILYTGKIQPKKGVFTLIKAIRYLNQTKPELKYLFIGPDTKINGLSTVFRIKKMIKDYHLNNVKFINNINREKLFEFYKQGTVCVIPSHWENYPNVCLEAMDSRLPVIASNVGGLREMIQDKINGLLFQHDDYKELAAKIKMLLESNRLNRDITSKAKKYITNICNVKRVSKMTVNYYYKVIESNKGYL